MKRKICLLLCGTLMMGLMSGCGQASTSTTGTETKETEGGTTVVNEATTTAQTESGSKENAEAQTVTIWHDGDEAIMQTIADEVNGELAAENVQVAFEKKTGLTDQLQLYGTDAQNGPDMYFYAHDSLGTFAQMGILAPITDFITAEDEANLLPMTVSAGTYQDTQYMLPVYYETLIFIYNKDLWDGEVPDTTDGLYDYMVAHTDANAGTFALVNQHSTAYNVAPYINGFGASIIDKEANPGLDSEEMKAAIEYNLKFAKLESEGDYDTCNTLFNEQKAAAIIGGPWLMSDIKAAGINYGIKSLAQFKLPNGNGLAPFSGIQGVGVLKYAEDTKKEAVTSVLKALCNEKVGIAIANGSNCAPANAKSYEDSQVAANEMIMAIKDTADTAQPMPNIPQMSVMWGPAEGLLAAVNKSGEDIESAAKTYQEQALTAIADMQ